MAIKEIYRNLDGQGAWWRFPKTPMILNLDFEPFAITKRYSDLSTKRLELRWIGNERGRAEIPCGRKIRPKPKWEYISLSLPWWSWGRTVFLGRSWCILVRSGWFISVKVSGQIWLICWISMDSVGRGLPSCSTIPPAKEGLLAEEDVQRLRISQVHFQFIYG